MSEQDIELGPIDYIVLEWPDRQPDGSVAPLLIDLVDRGIIRILDIAFMAKGEDGSVAALDLGALNGDGTSFAGPYTGSLNTAAMGIGPGVAPEAGIYALRVFGCAGSTALTVAAINWATDPNRDGDPSDHVDVINMSLGSSYGTPDDPSAAASNIAAGLGVLVAKHGPRGASVYLAGGEVIQAAPFPVEILNVLGAGDAFASGLLYGRLQGWDWHKSARMANATGAIVVTRPACANSMPNLTEVDEFVTSRGGL
jgi:hypothetical protein